MEIFKVKDLEITYERDRELFNKLLKINGVTKKDFCSKFELSYSYVNAWGSIINEKEKKFPTWVFIYLKDVIYFKVAAIRVKISKEELNNRLHNGKTLTEIYKELYTPAMEYMEYID